MNVLQRRLTTGSDKGLSLAKLNFSQMDQNSLRYRKEARWEILPNLVMMVH